MTGSGKTFTMFGDGSDGIVGLAARQLLATAGPHVTVGCAFMQLYGTQATDLLEPDAAPLRICRRHGEVVVEGQSVRRVRTPADVSALVAEGARRRRVASQLLNSTSSRSHAVLTFHVSAASGGEAEGGEGGGGEGGDGGDGGDESVAARASKLHCVDLAGCERVKESGVSGEALREAQAINLSLFHLLRVVRALQPAAGGAAGAEARVPYADSPLTTLLADALGGNCRTALLATLSPAQRHAAQTAHACAFAAACRHVRNAAARAAPRRVPRARPWAGADPSAAAARSRRVAARTAGDAAARLPWAGVAPGDAACPGGRRDVGGISCLVYGGGGGRSDGGGDGGAAARGVALVLHGNPSDAAAMAWLAPPLVGAGYLVCCPDMPGFGATPGPRPGTRSEQACEPGGAAEVVVRLLRALGARRAALVGYDWGAGVALAMAASGAHRQHVESVCAMHPAYAHERVRGELGTVQAPTLLLWAESNAFHPWARFKPLAAQLRARLGASYAEHRTRSEADAAWSAAARARAIVRFLTGVDPLPEAQAVAARPERAAVAADGARIVRADGVVFRAEVAAGAAAARRPDAARAACAALAAAERAGELAALLRALAGRGGAARAGVMARFARALPPLCAATLTPARLEALGLWPPAARAAAEALHARAAGAPRYFRGRRLLLPRRGGLGTLRAVCAARDAALLAAADGAPARVVSWRALLALNQRHLLPCEAGRDGAPLLRLEDGMWADFGAPLLRAEAARVALALGPVFATDVASALEAGDGDALDAARGAAVQAMRRCLDVTTFARDGGAARGRERGRYAQDDAAKMAAFGEGHCRTCSSCFAPFLWAFAELLCIDPHYCTDARGRHQWLQYEARPSMRAFTCDLYRDAIAGGDGALLCEPAEVTYATPTQGDEAPCGPALFPVDTPLELGGRRVASAPLEPTDVGPCLQGHTDDPDGQIA